MADEITLDAPETRLERFLAAAAGVDGITLDEPETRIERYLYKIAQGGGSGNGGVLVVTDTNGTLDKTWQEIHDAMLNGIVMVNVVDADGNEETLKTYIFNSTEIGADKGGNPSYWASAIGFVGENPGGRDYLTNSASGYPTLSV